MFLYVGRRIMFGYGYGYVSKFDFMWGYTQRAEDRFYGRFLN